MRRIVPIILFTILSFTLSAQTPGDPVWKIYYDSAQLFWNSDWQKTIPYLLRAERSALGDLGIYDANYLAILNDLGLSYARTKDYPNAERLLTKCLAIKKEIKTTPDADMFQSMANLAAIHAEQKHYRQAEELYKSMLSSAGPDTFTSIYWSTVNNLELLYEDEGNLEAARQLLDNLRVVHKTLGGSPIERYELELALGRIKRKLRKYEESKTILDPLVIALQDQEGPGLSPLYIESLQEIGVLYAETGAYSKAEIFFLEGLQLLRKQNPATNARLIEVLNNLASLYEKLGIYAKAIAYYLEALNLNSRFYGQNSLATITLQSNIAGIHLKEGNMSEAISSYEAISRSLLAQLTESSPFYITVLNNLATAYRRNNQIREATETLEKASNLVEKYGLANDDLGATIMNNMAVLFTARGEPEKAILYYEKAYAVKRKLYGDDSVLLMDLTGNMAVVYWALRKPTLALPLFQKSIGLSIKQINYIFPNLSEGEQIQFYKKLKEDFERFASIAFQSSDQDPELLTQVFNNQITIKSLLFFTQQHKRDLVLQKRDTVLSRQFELLKSKREQLGHFYQLSLKDLARMELTTTDLEVEIDNLEKAISLRTSETVAEKLLDNKIAWIDIKTKMRADESLIEVIRFRKYDVRTYRQENTERVSFGFADSVYYAALITTKETQKNPKLILLKEGKNMETRFLSYYRNALRFDYPDGNSYQQYWQPFESAIANKSKVYFSGDGVYHRINLNTIQKPGSDEFLLQRYDIHYLLNPAQFLEREPMSFLGKKAVLIGDPAFSPGPVEKLGSRSEEAQKFAPLPGTNGEVLEINAMLKNRKWSTTLLLQGQATEENLKRVQSPDILHIATHGFFSSDKVKLNLGAKNDFLFYSGLALAGANTNLAEGIVDAREDGIVTAYEVMNLNLTNTHLVVLSACETGLGKIENGEGVYGLQRSFLQAGARNIVISLWKVDDTITKELMVRFYQYLFQQKPEREALKLAQLDLLKKFRNPKGWGGFIVVGLD